MITNLTSQTAPVTERELDQLIWGLERYGLYPRQLAALKELRKVRKAGNSAAIGIDPAFGPDRTVEVRYVAPPGYVMVPVESTIEMLDEFDSIIDYGAEDSKDAWSRLIAAASKEVGR